MGAKAHEREQRNASPTDDPNIGDSHVTMAIPKPGTVKRVGLLHA
jgi:hypothetical protein